MVHPWPFRVPIWKSSPSFTCRTFPAVVCLLLFIGTFGSFFLFPFLLFRFLCVRVLGARHQGRARRRRECQRVLAGKGGVKGARSALSCLGVAWASRHERGKHEWVLSRLHLSNSIEYVGVHRSRSGLRDNIQAVLIFATKLKFTERAANSEHQHCRTGERVPR